MTQAATDAHRFASRSEDRHRHEVNATLHDLDRRLRLYREFIQTSRETREPHHRRDVLSSGLHLLLARTTARLVDLGEE